MVNEVLLNIRTRLDPDAEQSLQRELNRIASSFNPLSKSIKSASEAMDPLNAQFERMVRDLEVAQGRVLFLNSVKEDAREATTEVERLRGTLLEAFAKDGSDLGLELKEKINQALSDIKIPEETLARMFTELESAENKVRVFKVLGQDIDDATSKVKELKLRIFQAVSDNGGELSESLSKRFQQAFQEIKIPESASIAKALDVDKASSQLSSFFSQFIPGFRKLEGAVQKTGKAMTEMSRSSSPALQGLGKLAGLATNSITGLGVALAGTSFALRGIAKELEDAQRQLDRFLGISDAGEALIQSMAHLEAITRMSKIELAGLASEFVVFGDNINTVSDAQDLMNRLTVQTGRSAESLRKIPGIFAQIKADGDVLSDTTFRKLKRLIGEKIPDAAYKLQKRGVGAVKALQTALIETTGSAEEVSEALKITDGVDYMKQEWGDLLELMSDGASHFASLFGWITGGLLKSISFVISETSRSISLTISGIIGSLKSLGSIMYDIATLNFDGMWERMVSSFQSAFAAIKVSVEKLKEENPLEKAEKGARRIAEDLKRADDELKFKVRLGDVKGVKELEDRIKDLKKEGEDLLKTVSSDDLKFDRSGNFKRLLSAIEQELPAAAKKGRTSTEKELSELEKRYQKILLELTTAQSNQNFLKTMGLLDDAAALDTTIENLKSNLRLMTNEDVLNGKLLDVNESKLRDEISRAISAGIKDGAKDMVPSIVEPITASMTEVGNLFASIASGGALGAITGSLSMGQTFAGLFKDVFSSAPVIGGVLGGVSSLFTGIVTLFGQVSEARKAELDRIYNDRIDQINRDFEREHEMRQKNIDMLNKQLNALKKQMESGQLSAKEYFDASNQIGDKIEVEKIADTKAQRLAELGREEASKKREYNEENSKWFPDQKKLSSLSREINRLHDRIRKVQNAGTLADVRAAQHGAFMNVHKPTLMLVGENGPETVSVIPHRKALVDPALARAISGSMGANGSQQIFNINVSGFVGDEKALGAKLITMIQSSIDLRGEREFTR